MPLLNEYFTNLYATTFGRPKKMLTDQQMTFLAKVTKHWTKDRLEKLTTGHKYHVLPTTAAPLLRTLGILNSDATMSADTTRKFIQVNHLLSLLKPHFEDLNSRHKLVRILDAGCGSSVLTFTLAWAFKTLWSHPALVIGIDENKKLIDKCNTNRTHLSFDQEVHFFLSSISQFNWNEHVAKISNAESSSESNQRPHAVIALHACDTATDDALALAIKEKADFIAVAPCCQAELARKWKLLAEKKDKHPLAPGFHNPHLRRELAAQITDLMRVLILRGHGYEVTTTEFTMSHATPKNTLIVASRRGQFHKESQQEYSRLVDWCGGVGISLAEKAPF